MIRALVIALVLVASASAGSFDFSNTTVTFYSQAHVTQLYAVMAKWAAEEQPTCSIDFVNGYILASNCSLPADLFEAYPPILQPCPSPSAQCFDTNVLTAGNNYTFALPPVGTQTNNALRFNYDDVSDCVDDFGGFETRLETCCCFVTAHCTATPPAIIVQSGITSNGWCGLIDSSGWLYTSTNFDTVTLVTA